jgi:MoaA/NifB/PqqE/SkfB family radical SAM enzyme
LSCKDPEWFLDFPRICKELDIPQIALGGGEPLLDMSFVKSFLGECKEYSIPVSITTNGKLISLPLSSEHRNILKQASLISLSIDSYKVPSMESLNSQLMKAYSLRHSLGIQIGLNVLLDPYLLSDYTLYHFISYIRKTIGDTCNIYLLYPKPDHIGISTTELKEQILPVVARFKHIYVDSYIALNLGYIDHCPRGKEILSIHPDGSLHLCSFDKAAFYLDRPDDLSQIVSSIVPKLRATDKCICD